MAVHALTCPALLLLSWGCRRFGCTFLLGVMLVPILLPNGVFPPPVHVETS